MKLIAHRVNKVEDLIKLPHEYGVEIDLRDTVDGRIHVSHDPFSIGEDFEYYLQHHKHGTIVLNIKSERIELKVLEMLRKYGKTDYFFLDSSFPMIHLLTMNGEKQIALRFSEFEGIDTLVTMQNKVNWVWVDCFTKLPIDFNIFTKLKSMNYSLCMVSPELQGREQDILNYKKYLLKSNIVFDAICTKRHNIPIWS